MRGLYAIVDTGSLARTGHDPVAFAELVLAARPALMQIRDKRGAPRETLELLRQLVPKARAAGVPLFANDRADLARLAGCDGVHLGRQDVHPDVARAAGVTSIGMSTHNEQELDAALDEGELAYVAIGPVFGTTSKERPDPVLGIEGFRDLAGRARRARPALPIVAIGGLTVDRAAAVAPYCDLVCAIAALVPGPSEPAREATARAAAFGAAIVRAGSSLPGAR